MDIPAWMLGRVARATDGSGGSWRAEDGPSATSCTEVWWPGTDAGSGLALGMAGRRRGGQGAGPVRRRIRRSGARHGSRVPKAGHGWPGRGAQDMDGCLRDPIGKPARRDAGRGRIAGPRWANRTTEIWVPTGTRAKAWVTASMTSGTRECLSPPQARGTVRADRDRSAGCGQVWPSWSRACRNGLGAPWRARAGRP